MATKKSATGNKKRQVKPVETVRQKASHPVKTQPRRVRRAASVASRPLKRLGNIVAAIVRPFRFILRPFKTRPMRAIGRFLASVLLLRYFRNSWQELRKVEWPNASETARLSMAVFVFAIFFSIIISAADFGLDKLFEKLIIR